MQDDFRFVIGALGQESQGGGGLLWGDPAAAYREAELFTAAPARLAELLYDGAVHLCRQALEALDNGDFEPAADRLARARRIVRQLQRSLQPAGSSPSAQRLRDLCEQVHRRLLEADHYRRRESLSETLSLLTYQRPDWSAAIRRPAPACGRPKAEPAPDWIG